MSRSQITLNGVVMLNMTLLGLLFVGGSFPHWTWAIVLFTSIVAQSFLFVVFAWADTRRAVSSVGQASRNKRLLGLSIVCGLTQVLVGAFSLDCLTASTPLLTESTAKGLSFATFFGVTSLLAYHMAWFDFQEKSILMR